MAIYLSAQHNNGGFLPDVIMSVVDVYAINIRNPKKWRARVSVLVKAAVHFT